MNEPPEKGIIALVLAELLLVRSWSPSLSWNCLVKVWSGFWPDQSADESKYSSPLHSRLPGKRPLQSDAMQARFRIRLDQSQWPLASSAWNPHLDLAESWFRPDYSAVRWAVFIHNTVRPLHSWLPGNLPQPDARGARFRMWDKAGSEPGAITTRRRTKHDIFKGVEGLSGGAVKRAEHLLHSRVSDNKPLSRTERGNRGRPGNANTNHLLNARHWAQQKIHALLYNSSQCAVVG